jgi:hypothetical protein
MTHSDTPQVFAEWLADLEARHLADLRIPEVTRALRALSSAYVERRHKVAAGATLDSAGKRAAFALFYGPLHFITIWHVVGALGAGRGTVSSIVDLGCGTGVAGAAWALAFDTPPPLKGVDRHPWAIEETRWTYRQLGLRGHATVSDLTRPLRIAPNGGVIAGYALNELPPGAREGVERRLLDVASAGSRVLVVEPIARSVTPWWDALAARVTSAGGRADEWRFVVDLPERLRLFDRAAGLNHRELTARTLYLG